MCLSGIWCQSVISIEEHEIIPAAGAKAGVAGCSNTAVLLPQINNLRTARGDFRRIVRRIVVYDHDFNAPVRLRENALDRSDNKRACW